MPIDVVLQFLISSIAFILLVSYQLIIKFNELKQGNVSQTALGEAGKEFIIGINIPT